MDKEYLEHVKKQLEKKLNSHRYVHTLGVMYTAASLAMRYDCDVEAAMKAGLLHDCAKCIPNKEKISLCEKQGIPISDVELANPGLLHAKLGAYLAESEYGIQDKEILHAIEVHTTGCPEMTLLDKIIYIADFMEPYRDEAPNLSDVRALAFVDLDACLFRILKDTMKYLQSKKAPVDSMTETTYDYYKQYMKTRKGEQLCKD